MKTRESLPVLSAPPSGAACCAPAGRLARLAGALRGRRAWALLLLALAGGSAALGLPTGIPLERMGQEAARNLLFTARAFWEILPYFVLSVALSAWAITSGAAGRIRAVFERQEAFAILGAAAVGAVAPLCSCGVIPLIAALLAGGVPLGPVMAFWLSSPLMSPEKFTLTAGLLGMPYALMNLAVAVGLGIAAGALTTLLDRRGILAGQIRPFAGKEGCCDTSTPPTPPYQGGAKRGSARRIFIGEAVRVTLFLGKWLAVAFLLEALIVHYVDPAWIRALLGGGSPWGIPLATAVGIPLYTSGIASIPIVQGLLEGGMSPGAAMAFLIAGPVTTVPAMVAVWALVRGRVFALYLGASIAGSLIAGYAFQWIMG